MAGVSVEELARRLGIDPWFLHQLAELVALEDEWIAHAFGTDEPADRAMLRRMKRAGFSDWQLADLRGLPGGRIARHAPPARLAPGLQDGGHLRRRVPVDHALSLLLAGTRRTRQQPDGRPTVIILGSGPNRIGQGVEFDYCCVRATLAFRELGYRTVMVNSNPETVSTDFDISDMLYFEPLTLEDVLEIVHVEQPIGVVVQLGGQTPLKLAEALEAAGVPIMGTSPDAIDAAEDRQPLRGAGHVAWRAGSRRAARRDSVDEAVGGGGADRLPDAGAAVSYVLGGRAMRIVYDES